MTNFLKNQGSGVHSKPKEVFVMPRIFNVSFNDNETMPDRIDAMAADLGITPEQLIRRALADHLGGFGLQEVPPGVKVKTLEEFFVHSGVLKPTNPVRKEDEPCFVRSQSPNLGKS